MAHICSVMLMSLSHIITHIAFSHSVMLNFTFYILAYGILSHIITKVASLTSILNQRVGNRNIQGKEIQTLKTGLVGVNSN